MGRGVFGDIICKTSYNLVANIKFLGIIEPCTPMKKGIHPEIFDDVVVSCTGCGMSFTTLSTKKSISVHVCSKCHPFYTGEQRFIDTKGKVEKFQRKMSQAKVYKEKVEEKKSGKNKEQKETKSLRELLADM